MAIVHSTSTVHPRDRLSYWLEVATRAFVRHDFASSTGSSFRGALQMGELNGLGVSEYTCDPCRINRSARDIARCDSDDILLSLNLSGKGLHTQGGRQAVNQNGSFLLLDCRYPYATVYPEAVHSVTFKIPRQGLEARLGNLAGFTARLITPRGAVAGLASGFLSMLPSRVDTLDAAAGSKLAEQALDLIALAVAEEAGPSGVTLSSVRKATLFRLKSVIEAHLREPQLRPAAVAAETGISVRYANALLSQEGLSVERYILHRRLERCRQALEDGAQAHRLIGEIAFGWGFSDLSHFGRRFRAAYGLSPGDCRRRAQTHGTLLGLAQDQTK